MSWTKATVKQALTALENIEAEAVKQTALLERIAQSLKPSPVRLALTPGKPEPQ